MMHLLSDQLQKTVHIGFLGLSLILPTASQASLIGDTVNISFFDNSGNIGNYSDNITVASSGPAIASGDSTNIGTNVLLDGEYINIGNGAGANTGVITFNFQGGGAQLAAPQTAYDSTGYFSGDYFQISGLVDPALANSQISSLSVTLANAVNVQLNSNAFFSGNTVTLDLDQIGILNTNSGAADYGSVTLNLQFAPTAVPIPPAFLLFMSGLALFAPKAGLTRNSRVLTPL